MEPGQTGMMAPADSPERQWWEEEAARKQGLWGLAGEMAKPLTYAPFPQVSVPATVVQNMAEQGPMQGLMSSWDAVMPGMMKKGPAVMNYGKNWGPAKALQRLQEQPAQPSSASRLAEALANTYFRKKADLGSPEWQAIFEKYRDMGPEKAYIMFLRDKLQTKSTGYWPIMQARAETAYYRATGAFPPRMSMSKMKAAVADETSPEQADFLLQLRAGGG